MIKNVIINGITYYVEEGVVLNDKATEELDSLTFNIFNTRKIDLEPFQDVKVVFKDNTEKSFIVNTWIDEVATYNGLKNYTINCISETKKLERVAMPNMTITQPLGLSDNEKRKYDIYLNRAMQYVNKVYPDLKISNRLIDKMKDIIAVEEQFNNPNSKEYFNTILEKITAIVKVEEGYIDYFDLSKKGNAINESKILFTNNAQTIEDYYSDIVTDVQGVQSEDATIYTELVGVRSPENAVVTYDNAVVQLSHNINYLKEVMVWAKVKYNNEEVLQGYRIYGSKYQLIKEKAEYDLLKISNKLSDFSDDIKRSNLFFTRGSNTIEGLAYNEKTWIPGLSSVLTAIENIIAKINKDYNFNAIFDGDIRDLKFEVTYSALDDVSTKFEKDKTTKSVIRDNQTDSFIDLDKFAKAEQEKINRLGNPTLEINARYYDLADVPTLMDYIGDYILAEREIVYHRNYIDFKGVLYKDYVKKNLFYGVNAKKRSYNLMLGNEAVTRKELTKENYIFQYDDNSIDKNTQRYLLGKLVASNYTGNLFYADSLNNNWRFNTDELMVWFNIPSNEYVDVNINYNIIVGGRYYTCSKLAIRFVERDDSGILESFYELYYYIDGQLTLANNGSQWLNDDYKFIAIYDVTDSFDSNNTITKEEMLDFMKTNAYVVDNQTQEQPDEYNMYSDDFKPIQLVACDSHFNDGSVVSYKLEPDVRKANKSVTINLKWYDNINVGMKFDGNKIDTILDLINAKGGYGQQYVTYTDDNGELDSITLRLYDKYGYNIITSSNFNYVDNYPEINANYNIPKYKFYEKQLVRYKDNREILNETIQFEFSSDNGIFVNERFINMTPFFRKYKQWLYVYVSESEIYNQYNCDKVLPTANRMDNNLEIDYSDFVNFVKNSYVFNRIMLYNNNVDLTNVKSWAIADGNGNVYIAVNKRDTDAVIPTTIYLNKKED